MSEEKEINVEKKGIDLQSMDIQVPEKWMTGEFSDLVVCSSNLNQVNLVFLQKQPFKLAEGDKESSSVVSRVTLSWPHFFSFVKLINDTANKNKERVVKHLEDAIIKGTE